VYSVEVSRLRIFHETRTTNDVLAVIYEDTHNYHSKKIIVFDYDIKVFLFINILLNFIYIFFEFKLSYMKF
jgi:hypothetical protein